MYLLQSKDPQEFAIDSFIQKLASQGLFIHGPGLWVYALGLHWPPLYIVNGGPECLDIRETLANEDLFEVNTAASIYVNNSGIFKAVHLQAPNIVVHPTDVLVTIDGCFSGSSVRETAKEILLTEDPLQPNGDLLPEVASLHALHTLYAFYIKANSNYLADLWYNSEALGMNHAEFPQGLSEQKILTKIATI